MNKLHIKGEAKTEVVFVKNSKLTVGEGWTHTRNVGREPGPMYMFFEYIGFYVTMIVVVLLGIFSALVLFVPSFMEWVKGLLF